MHRIFLISSICLILGALILRKINADRVLRNSKKTHLSLTAKDLARKMLDSMDLGQVMLTTQRSWQGSSIIRGKKLALSPDAKNDTSANALGQAALRVGIYLLSKRDPSTLTRRNWAIRFGHAFPIFTTIVVVFALVVTKLPLVWALAIITTSLGLATGAQIISVTTDLKAADIACVILKKKQILPRLTDEEAVISATRAWAWYSIIPGFLSRFM